VTDIAVYVEGGGKTAGQKAELRQGFDALFQRERSSAREKRGSLRFVCCGGRQQAYDAFVNEFSVNSQAICALLVDSETPVPPVPADRAQDAVLRRKHLIQTEGTSGRGQGDGWQFTGVSPDRIHLMVQCMEAWIVADPEALEAFYRQGFRKNRLPRRTNLEDEPKSDTIGKLEAATEGSQKGEYAKIRHASQLLQKISREKICLKCPRFSIFCDWLTEQIES
jgi:hypothetical protein